MVGEGLMSVVKRILVIDGIVDDVEWKSVDENCECFIVGSSDSR